MVINDSFIDKNGKKYDGVIEKAFEKDELFDIGKFKHQTEREKIVFGKENGVYIYQDIENDNLAYRIYDEFAEYGFNGYHDDVLIYELNKRRENVKLTDFPNGIVTYNGNIIGQIIPYYPNSETIFSYAKETNNINIIKYYRRMLDILIELYNNGIIYCDAHAKNFLIVNNKVKLIDFDFSLMDFNNYKYKYENMINTFIGMVNTLNEIINVSYKVSYNDIRDLHDIEEVVLEMEKKLIK